jgi:hypothetical protein
MGGVVQLLQPSPAIGAMLLGSVPIVPNFRSSIGGSNILLVVPIFLGENQLFNPSIEHLSGQETAVFAEGLGKVCNERKCGNVGLASQGFIAGL